jgi:hypothetical protein
MLTKTKAQFAFSKKDHSALNHHPPISKLNLTVNNLLSLHI